MSDESSASPCQPADTVAQDDTFNEVAISASPGPVTFPRAGCASCPQSRGTRIAPLAEKWGTKYPAAVKLWRSAWSEFIPFLDYDVEIRKIICTTNAIESLNARYRRAVRARGHFPNHAAALKCLYLVTRSLDPTGRGRARWVIRWKAALNAFAITFEGRINPSN